ncbi:MAG: hypothetical protein E6R12_10650 [Sphingomonadales bacterium]|nr:MAG: hypothetical protein E6R12_10650 [Sphingomonadales bacterium]
MHEEFSPEELLGVELNIQVASEGGITKFRSGRTFTDDFSRKRFEKEKYLEGTIACVTGFLINIVEKTVKLISPVMPSSQYPDGYITFDERSYDTPQQIESLMWDIVDDQMEENLAGDRPVSFTLGGVYDPEHDQCAVRFRDFNIHNSQLSLIGGLLRTGEMDPISIVRHTSARGEQPLKTIVAIENLWREGVIYQPTTVHTKRNPQLVATA